MWTSNSMKYKLQAVFAAAALAVSVAAQGTGSLTINTPPSLISCQPASITWSGAQPPVYLSVLKGGDLSSAPLRQFPEQQAASGSYPWTVDLGSGTSVTLQIRDGTGQTQASAPVNILSGPDNKQCTGNGNNTATPAGSPGGGSGSGSGSQPASSPSPAPAPSSPSSSGSSASKNTSSSAPAAAGPSSPTTSSTGSTMSNTSSSSTPASTTKKNGASTVMYQPSTAVLVLCLSAAAVLVGQSSL